MNSCTGDTNPSDTSALQLCWTSQAALEHVGELLKRQEGERKELVLKWDEERREQMKDGPK